MELENNSAITKLLLETKPLTKPMMHGADDVIRRLQDLLVAVVGSLVLAPFFLIIAILIKRDSPGPIFYRGPRVGKDGRLFGILKFRTMYERPESYAGARLTGQGDSRVTPFGQWLRDTKVNELPQLWNVLVGEMSLVGPRPEDPQIAADLPEDLRAEILSVRPGVTSPASVLYHDEEHLLSSAANLMEDYWQTVLPSKLRLDLLYVRNRNYLADLDIIFWTVIVLLPKLRKHSVPEHLLYWGPLSRLFTRVLNWFVVDFVVSLLAVAAAGVIWRSIAPYDVGIEPSVLMALLAALSFSLFNKLLRLDQTEWSRASASNALDLALSSGIMTGLMSIINTYYFEQPIYPLGMLVTSGMLATAGFVAVRYRERLLTGLATRWLKSRQIQTGERVLIVGAGEMGHFASWMFKHSDFARAFHVAGMVDDNPRKVGMVVDGNRVMNTADAVPDLVKQLDIGVILFAINRIQPEQRERILALCRQSGARVVLFPDVMAYVQESLLPAASAPETVQTVETNPLPELNPVCGVQTTFEQDLQALEVSLASSDVAMARQHAAHLREKYPLSLC